MSEPETDRGILDVLPARTSGDDREFIRLECLRLAVRLTPSGWGAEDVKNAIRAARKFEAYVMANPDTSNLADTQ